MNTEIENLTSITHNSETDQQLDDEGITKLKDIISKLNEVIQIEKKVIADELNTINVLDAKGTVEDVYNDVYSILWE